MAPLSEGGKDPYFWTDTEVSKVCTQSEGLSKRTLGYEGAQPLDSLVSHGVNTTGTLWPE